MNLAHIFDHECPNILIFDEVDSTSSEVKRLFLSGFAEEGLVVYSDKQTSGYGKGTRVWQSEAGNAHFSFLLKSSLPLTDLVKVNFLLALALREMLLEHFSGKIDPDDLQVKWPNDLLYKDKKFCGILSEAICDSFGSNYVICGIGLNVGNSPSAIANTTSLAENGLQVADKISFVMDFLYKFEPIFLNWQGSQHKDLLIKELNHCLAYKNQQVFLHYNDQEYKGVVEEVGLDGRLNFKVSGGENLLVASGDVYRFCQIGSDSNNVIHMKREE